MFVPITPEMSVAFGTPLSIRTVPGAAALNAGLERAILARHARGEANRISNVGGWQSLPDLFDWPEPEIKILASEIDRSVQAISQMPSLVEQRRPNAQTQVAYRAYAWANVNQSGHYNMLHVHPGNHWSVVYYVSVGTPSPETPTNGRIELRDPRPAAGFARMPGFNEGQPMLIQPQAGMMLLFPAWIEHWVHPFHGEGTRISIATNVTIENVNGGSNYFSVKR